MSSLLWNLLLSAALCWIFTIMLVCHHSNLPVFLLLCPHLFKNHRYWRSAILHSAFSLQALGALAQVHGLALAGWWRLQEAEQQYHAFFAFRVVGSRELERWLWIELVDWFWEELRSCRTFHSLIGYSWYPHCIPCVIDLLLTSFLAC